MQNGTFIWQETEIGGFCNKKINKLFDFRNAITTYLSTLGQVGNLNIVISP